MGKKSPHGAPLAWLHANVSHEGSECLIWPFAKSARGYGNIRVNAGYTSAHRVMCILAHGQPFSDDLHAAHSCGRGHEGCVNPTHLSWKTSRDNHADMIGHGTLVRGRSQWKSRLTEQQVLAIFADKRPDSVIAKDYQCSRENVTRIQARKAWAWLTNSIKVDA